jgi:hypothetical protein
MGGSGYYGRSVLGMTIGDVIRAKALRAPAAPAPSSREADVARAIEGGLSAENIGGLYPVAVVGYGDEPVRWGVEDFQRSTVLRQEIDGLPRRWKRAKGALKAATKAAEGNVPVGLYWG